MKVRMTPDAEPAINGRRPGLLTNAAGTNHGQTKLKIE